MREHGEPVEPKNVAATLGVALNVVSLAFGRLKKQQRITKAEDGTYSHVG
jgi:predicted transcriptional regulator of viral defense system